MTGHRGLAPGLSLVLPPEKRGFGNVNSIEFGSNLFISKNEEERLGLSVRGAGFSVIDVVGDCNC